MYGITAKHIYSYLEIHDFQANYLFGKLLSHLTKDKVTKRIDKLLELRRILGAASSTCGDLFDLDSVVKGEARGLSGIID